jgi:hypothetical protein
LGAACGIAYPEALAAGFDHFNIQGVEIPVASKELLIRMKATIRESDALDVRFLRLRIEEEEKRK